MQLPPSDIVHIVHNASNGYSCVAKAGLGAKVQWFNASGHIIPEHSPNDTGLPPIYATYSITNVSIILGVNTSSYTGDPINSTYPVHNATLHFNGDHDGNTSFTCAITGVNMEFMKQYDVFDDNLTHSTTVNYHHHHHHNIM